MATHQLIRCMQHDTQFRYDGECPDCKSERELQELEADADLEAKIAAIPGPGAIPRAPLLSRTNWCMIHDIAVDNPTLGCPKCNAFHDATNRYSTGDITPMPTSPPPLFPDTLSKDLHAFMNLTPDWGVDRANVMHFIYGDPYGIDRRKCQLADFLISRMREK